MRCAAGTRRGGTGAQWNPAVTKTDGPDLWGRWKGAWQRMRQKRAQNRAERRFIRTFGDDYLFLLTEQEGKIAPERKGRYAGWSTQIDTPNLAFRFVWDRGDIAVEVSPRNDDFEWISDYEASALLLAGELNEFGKFPAQRIELRSAAEVIRSHFAELEIALSPQNRFLTRGRLDAVRRSFSNDGPLQIIQIGRNTSGFLANYAQISAEIGEVPFWKPLGIYAGLLLLLPLALLTLLIVPPLLFMVRVFGGARRG